MISRRDLLNEIDKFEGMSPNMTVCEKLAHLYTMYDHLYGQAENTEPQKVTQINVIIAHGDSDFIRAVDGLDGEAVWPILDELMDCVKTLQPRVYDSVMRRLRAIE